MKYLYEISKKKERLIIGTMSGTSTDGIDVALIKIKGSRLKTELKVVAFDSFPFPEKVRKEIFQIYPPNQVNVEEIARISNLISEIQAESIIKLVSKSGCRLDEIDLISMYGLTLYHEPPDRRKKLISKHLEIGEPAIVMERTGITTLSDLRMQDIAVGGEGCPLVPYADWILYCDKNIGRAVQNIGGIGNVTGIPPSAKLDDLIAFDTGPGNMIVDGLVKFFSNGREKFDRNGRLAAQGTVNQKLLDLLMGNAFIKKVPPKSTGRELFGEQYCKWLLEQANEMRIAKNDLLATATAFTAESIAYSYRRFLFPHFDIDQIILGGGGAKNSTLVNMIRERLAPIKVFVSEDFGLKSEAKEAVSWAILGNEVIQGKTCNVPSATGANRGVLLGKLLPGHRCIIDD